jgi:hypothetical protein
VTTNAPVDVDEETVLFVTAIAPDVNKLLPIVIPEPVESCVLPDAVLSAVPTRNLVAVDASVLTNAAEEAVPENVPAVIVLPTIDMFVST